MTKVTVIAHSLGAPVSRRALLDAIRNQASWAGKTRLQLFAPAHMGANLNKVRKELGIASRLIASLTALTKFGVLSLDGLEPGSPFLTQLMEDSSKELANGWDAQVKARQVIFGDGENVVMVQRFLEDPPHTVWPGMDIAPSAVAIKLPRLSRATWHDRDLPDPKCNQSAARCRACLCSGRKGRGAKAGVQPRRYRSV
ncbi:hypothetical protein [Sinorhizobium meliloti]|uniref:hypothetical protein n=1 Tax=Rhizobium meliloti TaxID=382 RepID=UPI001F28A991|nr:hypothetical protein [Sinorhizobium meliloti]